MSHLRSDGFISIDDFYRYLPPTAAEILAVCHERSVCNNDFTRSKAIGSKNKVLFY
ncbi:MAG: hypothetical protein RBR35_04475 [Salinivirgaceae bacterium]|nr:hypothetical protein [Salinivirgaceae bacterium]MDY0279798.1 hypothetical protein [Salinivirgaceae bacterium]